MKILFLCTGNYYRSRFAEEYFNHHAALRNANAQSYSMGIMRNFEGNGNVGPISQDTLNYLASLSVKPKGHGRMPVHVQSENFLQFDRVVAVSRDEHKPMLKELWPNHTFDVEFFDVEDLHIEGPDTALPRLVKHLDDFINKVLKVKV